MTLSLELSRRLHELGVKVESGNVWVLIEEPEGWELWSRWTLEHNPYHREDKHIPAPTFTELWAVMPIFIEHDGDSLVLHMSKLDGTDGSIESATTVYYMDWEIIIHETVHAHELPIEAAGMLLIWLAENGHLEVKS